MWYLAEILFAEPPASGPATYQCESSNVLLRADSAVEAYRRAIDWGLAYVAEPDATMRLLGVASLTTIGDELGDGTDLCGRLFQESDVWAGNGRLIPVPNELAAVRWEHGQDVPLDSLLAPDQLSQLRRVWGGEP